MAGACKQAGPEKVDLGLFFEDILLKGLRAVFEEEDRLTAASAWKTLPS